MRLAGEIRLRASIHFWIAVAALHGLAAAVTFCPGMPAALPVIGVPLILISAVFSYRQWQRSRTLVFRLADDGSAYAPTGEGTERLITFEPPRHDHGSFMVLTWTEMRTGRVGRVYLTPGMLSPAEWRLLRSWLRWRVPNRGAQPDVRTE